MTRLTEQRYLHEEGAVLIHSNEGLKFGRHFFNDFIDIVHVFEVRKFDLFEHLHPQSVREVIGSLEAF